LDLRYYDQNITSFKEYKCTVCTGLTNDEENKNISDTGIKDINDFKSFV
jgi:hypothetical protein